MGESFRTQAEMMGGDAHSEFDEVKRMLKETNPILLSVTFTVSILHSVFEFLAFKNGQYSIKNNFKGKLAFFANLRDRSVLLI